MTTLGSLALVGLFGAGVLIGWRMTVMNRRLEDLVSQALHYQDIPDHVPAEWVYDEWWKK